MVLDRFCQSAVSQVGGPGDMEVGAGPPCLMPRRVPSCRGGIQSAPNAGLILTEDERRHLFLFAALKNTLLGNIVNSVYSSLNWTALKLFVSRHTFLKVGEFRQNEPLLIFNIS